MKQQDIYDLIDRFEAGGLARLKFSSGDVTLELEKGAPAPAVPAPIAAPSVPAAPQPATSAAAPSPDEAPTAHELPAITAPLVGTFYVAPSPDKDPYVQPGEKVKKGATVCLLEAMKMMSEVTAPCDCVIEEIVAADGELVSFGAPLIRYREA